MPSMNFSAHGHSDVGFLRESNEDSFIVRNDKAIFAVADGVGGLPLRLISKPSCCPVF